MPEQIEEILDDKQVIIKKLLSIRVASLKGLTSAEVERDIREYIKLKKLDIEPTSANETKLLNSEKQIEFENIVIATIDKRLKKLND